MLDSTANREVPNTDHVVRYLNKEKWCPSDGSGLKPSAFESGTSPTDGVSVNWLEFFHKENEVKSLTEIKKTCGLCTRKSGRFLKLRVGDIKKIASEISPPVTVIHDGHEKGTNKSHAEIHPPIQATFVALVLCAEHYGTYLEVPSE